jgi:hypothetical protein
MASTTTNTTTQPATSAPSADATTAITGATGARQGRKIDVQASYQALITGLNSAYQPTDTFVLRTETLTRDELTARLNGVIVAAEATKTARQQYHSAVNDEQAIQAQMSSVRSGVRGIIQARIGADNPAVAQFGFLPTKPGKKSAASKATAVVKAKATRSARHTMGKNQKEEIRGDAPTTAPAAPAATAPAQSPTPAPAGGVVAPGQTAPTTHS